MNISLSNPIIRSATLEIYRSLENFDMAVAERFLDDLSDSPQLLTDASLVMYVMYGRVYVRPGGDYNKWVYRHKFSGFGLVGGSATGVMVTTYADWNSFFKGVTKFHVEGITQGGGILQIHFFEQGNPVDLFFGAMIGIGGYKASGKGKWETA